MVHPDYQTLLGWPFPAQPFYEAQVAKALQHDIPTRMLLSFCQLFVYRDPTTAELVGFGTLDVCTEYAPFVSGKRHCYLPLLGVKPGCQGRGYGHGIVKHLTDEAALIVSGDRHCSDKFILDVYTANCRA